jgi:hypothetical protein
VHSNRAALAHGFGLLAQPAVQAMRARRERSPCLVHARGGALASGAVMADRRQGVPSGHEGTLGVVPGRTTGAGAHRSGLVTVRRRRARAVVFPVSSGASVHLVGSDMDREHLGASRG